MLKWLKGQLKGMLPRRQDLIARALRFSSQNPKVIVMILDPKKDDIVAAYGKKYSAVNIRKTFLNLKVRIISELLRGHDVDRNINRILKVMDGFLYNLSKKVAKDKKK